MVKKKILKKLFFNKYFLQTKQPLKLITFSSAHPTAPRTVVAQRLHRVHVPAGPRELADELHEEPLRHHQVREEVPTLPLVPRR